METNVTTEQRAASFLAIADFLIPAHKAMPKFSDVCSWDDAMHALGFRPDLKDGFFRGLDSGDALAGAEAMLETLNGGDGDSFTALTTVIITTYYMNPAVREGIGYPGQENVAYDPLATQTYLTDGALLGVLARGRKFRPTPGLLP